MANDIFIGIDGGASKTKIRIENSAGELLGQAVGGPANIRLSVEVSWHSILQAIEEALSATPFSLRDKKNHFHAGMALAGCEVPDACDAFLKYPHPFVTLHLVSDAHAACVGAHQGKDGAIIIVGTGVVGYQIEKDRGVKVGGWGFPHDDEGSGAWLGLEAARLTFQWLDHRTEKSPLVEDIFAFFNSDLEKFVTWANRANSSEFAKLAPLVINHSQQHEALAIRLMKKAAHAVDRVGNALHKLQSDKNKLLPCSLFGGIAPFIEPWLGEELRSSLVPRTKDANAGVILMLRKKLAEQKKYSIAEVTQ